MIAFVTGSAGFIGYHLADRLLRDGCRVVGVDSLNDYYDPRLKQARLERLRALRSRAGDETAIEVDFAGGRAEVHLVFARRLWLDADAVVATATVADWLAGLGL